MRIQSEEHHWEFNRSSWVEKFQSLPHWWWRQKIVILNQSIEFEYLLYMRSTSWCLLNFGRWNERIGTVLIFYLYHISLILNQLCRLRSGSFMNYVIVNRLQQRMSNNFASALRSKSNQIDELREIKPAKETPTYNLELIHVNTHLYWVIYLRWQ